MQNFEYIIFSFYSETIERLLQVYIIWLLSCTKFSINSHTSYDWLIARNGPPQCRGHFRICLYLKGKLFEHGILCTPQSRLWGQTVSGYYLSSGRNDLKKSAELKCCTSKLSCMAPIKHGSTWHMTMGYTGPRKLVITISLIKNIFTHKMLVTNNIFACKFSDSWQKLKIRFASWTLCR
jgi:hypothetical protein